VLDSSGSICKGGSLNATHAGSTREAIGMQIVESAKGTRNQREQTPKGCEIFEE